MKAFSNNKDKSCSISNVKKILFFVFLFFSLCAYSKDSKKNRVGINGAYVYAHVLNFADGGSNYDLDNNFTLGFSYSRKIKNNLEFQTGINWSRSEATVTYNNDGNTSLEAKFDYNLISVPVFLNRKYSRFLFLNGGLLLDVDISNNYDKYNERKMDDQTGIGFGFGGGAEYTFKSGISIFINPYVNLHSVIGFTNKNGSQRIFETGIKGGLYYEF